MRIFCKYRAVKIGSDAVSYDNSLGAVFRIIAVPISNVCKRLRPGIKIGSAAVVLKPDHRTPQEIYVFKNLIGRKFAITFSPNISYTTRSVFSEMNCVRFKKAQPF